VSWKDTSFLDVSDFIPQDDAKWTLLIRRLRGREQLRRCGDVMLMMIRRLLAAVIALLLMFAGGRELMRMLIIGRVWLADDAIAASRFRLHSRHASGSQERGMSEINGSVGRRWWTRRLGRLYLMLLLLLLLIALQICQKNNSDHFAQFDLFYIYIKQVYIIFTQLPYVCTFTNLWKEKTWSRRWFRDLP